MKKFVCADMNRFNSLITQTDSIYREAAFKLGLTYSAMMVLYAVFNNGGSCPISDICAFGINKQTVNSALRKLETEAVGLFASFGGFFGSCGRPP